ncbi:MAG: dihydrodipicolinate synthase family protein [Planctomycetia bacterium]
MLIAAVHTPFDSSGRLATGCVERQARSLAASGVAGVFVGGTTGESLSLTLSERMELAASWAPAARRHGLALYVHVGSLAIGDARALAEQAEALSADAISAMAPSYFKPAGCKELAVFLGQIAAAAPRTPFYYYDIPSLTGVTFRSSEILEEHLHRIPTLAGVKYTSSDLVDFQRCIAAGAGRFKLFWGCDEALLAGLSLGAHGGIGSTYNFAADKALSVIDAFRRGDLAAARTSQMGLLRLVDALARHGYLPASKAVMALLGIDCGSVRPPLRPLDAAQLAALRADCMQAGVPVA